MESLISAHHTATLRSQCAYRPRPDRGCNTLKNPPPWRWRSRATPVTKNKRKIAVKLDIKAELLRELALEIAIPSPDIGLRAGADAFHPHYRGRVITSFASWDLLDVLSRREISAAVVAALEQFGVASGLGRFSGALTAAHAKAEQRMAQFFAAESALLFSSRSQAALTCITALCSEGWIVLGGSLSPLPVADACALVGAEFHEFESAETLRALLERFQLAKRVLVVVESVSSVTAEVVLAPQTWAMLEQAGAWVIADETAALGAVGLRGAGSAEVMPKSSSLVARLVSFAPLSGLEISAVVIANESKELLLRRSRYLRVEPPPSAPAVSAAEALLDLIEVAITQRDRLASRARIVETALKSQGWSVIGGGEVPFVSVWFDSLQKARIVQEALLQRGIFVDALTARSIRKNGAVLRVLVSVGHAPHEVEALVESFGEVRRRTQSEK